MTELVIAGGGLAGGAAACLLAQAGQSVVVLEREIAPVDKICGEFISEEAQIYLRRIGIDLAALGARPITRLRLVHGERTTEAALPFRAFGLSRRVLDEALLRHAAACGAEIRRGHAVAGVHPDGRIMIDVAGQDSLSADAVFLATGKHDTRGLRRQPTRTPEDLVGFKMHFRLDPGQLRALDGYVEVLMFRHGYAGLQVVEQDRANLCLLVDRAQLRRAGGNWSGLLEDLRSTEPHLAARLDGAQALLAQPVSIYRVPYGFVHAPVPADPPGVFRLGDQVGVIASFTGDGMAIALHSAAVASEVFLQGRPAGDYHRRIRADIAGQIRLASALYRFGRWRPGRAIVMALGAAWPRGVQLAASLTRVPPRALLTRVPPRALLTRVPPRALLRRLGGATLLLMLSATLSGAVWAQSPSPVGLWRTFDDRTGRERGLVRIREENGVLIGSIAGTIDPAEAVRSCDKCQGGRKGQPILGLVILTGLHRKGDVWEGGEIVDPETGSVYRCSVHLADGGSQLVLRGYIGIPLLGRTQTWLRAP